MFILGEKLKMSRIYDGEEAVPVTIVRSGPVFVTQVKTKERDGYPAVQVGFGKVKRLSKPLKGHLKDLGNFRHLKEFRLASETEALKFKTGDRIDVSVFKAGDRVKVSGIVRGRGFQGVVKRHGFSGGPKTHGQKNRQRAPGSIGSTAPQRVLPGKKMAGRMGGTRTTVKNLTIAKVDPENDILMVKGAVPGMKGTILEIRN